MQQQTGNCQSYNVRMRLSVIEYDDDDTSRGRKISSYIGLYKSWFCRNRCIMNMQIYLNWWLTSAKAARKSLTFRKRFSSDRYGIDSDARLSYPQEIPREILI